MPFAARRDFSAGDMTAYLLLIQQACRWLSVHSCRADAHIVLACSCKLCGDSTDFANDHPHGSGLFKTAATAETAPALCRALRSGYRDIARSMCACFLAHRVSRQSHHASLAQSLADRFWFCSFCLWCPSSNDLNGLHRGNHFVFVDACKLQRAKLPPHPRLPTLKARTLCYAGYAGRF